VSAFGQFLKNKVKESFTEEEQMEELWRFSLYEALRRLDHCQIIQGLFLASWLS
jgi:hypothetical protein